MASNLADKIDASSATHNLTVSASVGPATTVPAQGVLGAGTMSIWSGSYTLVSSSFGDDLLFEDNSGFGVDGKISFENTFIVVEQSLETGQIPFGATGNTTLASFTRPSDIFVSIMGRLMLEDIDQGDNIVYDTAIDAGDEILLEDGTEENILEDRKAEYLANETGWSGTMTFDDTNHSFDVATVKEIV